ncbi:MAG: 9-O-acetylesterase, partial [bacterium]
FISAAGDPNRRANIAQDQDNSWWNGIDRIAADGADAVGTTWNSSGFDDSRWNNKKLPGSLGGGDGLEKFDGVVYYRKSIDIPAEWIGADATLELGPIDDRDEAFINGVKVGGTREDGKWNSPRKYTVPAAILNAGTCTVSVRMLDTAGLGGINGKAEQMVLRSANTKLAPIALAGDWKFRKGPSVKQLPPFPGNIALNPSTPTVLFNGLIAPITPMTIKGAIWYQGESNVGRAAQYAKLFPAMISDWRRAFGI